MFCKNCGNQLNNGDNHCSKCGALVGVNNNDNNNTEIQTQPKKKVSFFKIYFKIFAISFVWFFIMSIISMAIGVSSSNNIMSLLQFGLPILVDVYGLIGTIIYTVIKNRN